MEKTKTEQTKTSIKKPLIILGIIFIAILILTLGFPAVMLIKSKVQCGAGGILVGDLKSGYICTYTSVLSKDEGSSCPVCSQLCESKGKVEKAGGSSNYYDTHGIDLTNSITMNSDGTFSTKESPRVCNCECSKVELNSNISNTTVCKPLINILSPDIGQVFTLGQTINIKWDSKCIDQNNSIYLNIYVKDTLREPELLRYFKVSNTGYYDFKIPEDYNLNQYGSNKYIVEVGYVNTDSVDNSAFSKRDIIINN